MTSKSEIWKSHPDIPGLQVSTLGRVRTLDKMVWNGKGTWLMKGRILKQRYNHKGYMRVGITIDGKRAMKSVHRLVAQTFLPNPDNLPEVNHKNCVRDDNRVGNLEWCTASYNSRYREKHGEAKGHPVFAINLTTLEVSQFKSQAEAGRVLGAGQQSINKVINGKLKQTNGYLFKEDDGNGVEIDKDKLNDIADNMPFTGGVFAINLTTLEVSQFRSQAEASLELGVDPSSIGRTLKGNQNQAGGFWFVKDGGNAVDVVKRKLHDIGGVGLKIKYRAVK